MMPYTMEKIIQPKFINPQYHKQKLTNYFNKVLYFNEKTNSFIPIYTKKRHPRDILCLYILNYLVQSGLKLEK